MNMFLLVAVTHSSELSLLVLNSRAAALELLWQCEIALTAMGKSLGKCDLKFEMEMLGKRHMGPFHQPTLFCNLEWQARTLLGCRSIPEEADCDNLKHQVGALLFTSFRMAGPTPTPPAMHAAPPPELGSAGPALRSAASKF